MKRRAKPLDPKMPAFSSPDWALAQVMSFLKLAWARAANRCTSPEFSANLAISSPSSQERNTPKFGLENLKTLAKAVPKFPKHSHVHGRIESCVEEIQTLSEHVDAILLDLPDHSIAIKAVSPLLSVGGRLSCYCPVSSQLEHAWIACEEAGLEVEWAGEVIEREWGKASKGGVRPVNGPFGHTAFLLIAQRKA